MLEIDLRLQEAVYVSAYHNVAGVSPPRIAERLCEFVACVVRLKRAWRQPRAGAGRWCYAMLWYGVLRVVRAACAAAFLCLRLCQV